MNFFILYFFLISGLPAGENKIIESIPVQSLLNSQEEILTIRKQDKPLVFIFLSKDCPCSKGNLGYIDQLSREYPEFSFRGIHAKKGTGNEEIRQYLSDKKLSFPVYNDSLLHATNLFNALKTPHAYIVNQAGEILYNGGISNSTFPKDADKFFLKDALEDVKHRRPVSKPESKTLGCFIVR